MASLPLSLFYFSLLLTGIDYRPAKLGIETLSVESQYFVFAGKDQINCADCTFLLDVTVSHVTLANGNASYVECCQLVWCSQAKSAIKCAPDKYKAIYLILENKKVHNKVQLKSTPRNFNGNIFFHSWSKRLNYIWHWFYHLSYIKCPREGHVWPLFNSCRGTGYTPI